MALAKKHSRLVEFLIIFAIAYLASQVIMKLFFSDSLGGDIERNNLLLIPEDATIRGGHHPVVTLENYTEQEVTLADRCPNTPLDVYRVEHAGRENEEFIPLHAEETILPCVAVPVLSKGEKARIDFAPWKYSLFSEYGVYEIRVPEGTEGAAVIRTRVKIHEPGFLVQTFRTFITKPFLNFLIFVASLLPDHNVGIAIIVLTFLVKFALFFPQQHALEGQRKMQILQPKLTELKERHKGDQTRLQQETMKLWKEHNVNPFQSCLPIVIQFPILIGLFFVIRDGSVLELSRHLIYPMYSHIDWSFGTNFLGLDLTEPSRFILPPLLVVLQFLQMKMSFGSAKPSSL